MIKVGIVGATGYAGTQLVWILQQHKKVTIEFVSSHSYAGETIDHVYPNYAQHLTTVLHSPSDIEQQLANIDVLFIALPHGMSETLAQKALQHNIKVIDLGADFRLDDSETYQTWYQVKHQFPEINQQAVYGLPELHGAKIKSANIVASPGCYPTSIILATAPLLHHQLINNKIIIDAKSGVSGAGRTTKQDLLYSEVNENIKAYNLFKHRHSVEIKQEFDKLGNDNFTVIFTPHLVPMNRGILSTIYVEVKDQQVKNSLTEEQLYALYRHYYAQMPFVRISSALPEVKHVRQSNLCDIGLRYDPASGTIIVVAVIDNLIKGASGQAVQSMNLLFGLEETEGLMFLSMYL